MHFTSSWLIVILMSIFTWQRAHSAPNGVTTAVCSSLTPLHTAVQGSNATNSPNPPGGFYIYTELLDDDNDGNYTEDTMYKVTLQAIGEYPFRGFVIQAREADTTDLIGSFSIVDSDNTQLLECFDDGDSTVTHTRNNSKSRVSFYWTSPDYSGTVDFRYSVVTTLFMDYYADLSAFDFRPPCDFPPTLYGDHTLRFGIPEGCSGTDCDYYLGLRQNQYNSAYLDVYLSGKANGWVAIGFSRNRQMKEDDVLGCRVDSGTMVTTVDTWNPSTRHGANQIDPTQTDICQHSASITEGRISCSFSRLIEAIDEGFDYDLNDDFWLFYGRRLTAQSSGSALGSHRVDGINPIISEQMYNPVMDTNVVNCPMGPGSGDDDYEFEFRRSDYYLATRVNPNNENYLEIALEGSADGWVAVGFSRDQLMGEDDVLGCRVDAGMVTVVDTWNPSPRRTSNMIDSSQTDICVHSTSFSEGRISCRFSRLINGTNTGQDYSLDSNFWLFYGRRLTNQNTGTGLGSHRVDGINPAISESQVNPANQLQPNPTDDNGGSVLALSSVLLISIAVALTLLTYG